MKEFFLKIEWKRNWMVKDNEKYNYENKKK